MLKSRWCAPGHGATVGQLRKLLDPAAKPEPNDTLKTSLEVEPYCTGLRAYDAYRADLAIAAAIAKANPVPDPED